MATKTQAFSVSVKDYESLGQLVMDALVDYNNSSTSFDGKDAKCDEISAPMVGVGANSWRRGRTYSVIAFDPKRPNGQHHYDHQWLDGCHLLSKVW